MEANEFVVRMEKITKIYPNGIAANRDVDFTIRKGEIHALIGENGAGKSTLMKILFGLEQPTDGTIYLNDERVTLSSPLEAISKGIGMVHQHFMLVSSLTVAENIVLGMAPKKGGLFIDYKEAVRLTREYSERYNLFVEPDARVADIAVGMKQKVEILKALVRGAQVLILDEPTAVLTTQETVELFQELKNLKEQGFTIVFISHKLKEIKELTDRITIMRAGRSVGVYDTDSISEQEISRLMVGRDVVLRMDKPESVPGERVLCVEDLHYINEWDKKMLDGISFSVRQGEIVGIAGVEGNGQRELVDILFGLKMPDSGDATIDGQSLIGLPQARIRTLGVSYVPEDRMTFGVAQTANIQENMVSDRYSQKRFNKGPLFNMKSLYDESDKLIMDYAVLCKSRAQEVGMLSGGNIQKVVVAREFSSDPILIIADQPTRGIDVGATELIRNKLVELSRAGAAVLLVSADLNEVMELSDNLIVMYNGQIAGYFDDGQWDDLMMGEYMLGLKRQSDEEIRRACHA
ncbi:MAG TPA: ABC transporter ATP-binding protein [Bacillota bacterium]|jgi:simple sugar transport system ATP-binding protein|nr:ABC transporter ATP-binding protein [Bacillota bacterium]